MGAVINFQAGTVRRAPHVLRKLGLEWLWRIKEEPYLWRRYWHDGGVLLRLLVTRLLPLAISARRLRRRASSEGHDLVVVPVHSDRALTLRLVGCATAEYVANAGLFFRDALTTQKQIVVDFAETKAADARFFGLLLMLKKQLEGRGPELQLVGVSIEMAKQFRLHGLGYLLSARENRHVDAVY
jgi:N-acetylglucosaminyldiphosphoundecaprenol N-acetyl-beta-D-mannosaminyltransferase